MAAPLKHDYPSDGEMVALFAQHGSGTRVAAEIGVHQSVLRAYLCARKRSALRATCEAVQPQRPGAYYKRQPSTTNYPSDGEMVVLMAECRSFNGVARAVGVNRESLRDYLRRRPALDSAMRAHMRPEWKRSSVALAPPKPKFRPQPWSTKPRRRSWVRRHATDPDGAVAYADILKDDPCAYCGAMCAEIDHIEPVGRGGSGDYENLTASCRHCNRAKNARPMLYHMLRRAEGWA
jgi:hypothetical protein